MDAERQQNSYQSVKNGSTPYHNGGIFIISKITSCYKPRTINPSEIRILIGQFKFIAYPYVSSSQSDNLPHNGVNVKETQFNYKGPSLQHCLQYESYGIWLKGTLYQLETKNCLLRYASTLSNKIFLIQLTFPSTHVSTKKPPRL